MLEYVPVSAAVQVLAQQVAVPAETVQVVVAQAAALALPVVAGQQTLPTAEAVELLLQEQ